MTRNIPITTRRAPRLSGGFARPRRGGFTLTELLIVVGIIIVLLGLLVPVVGRIRTQAQSADTRAFIGVLDSAIRQYAVDHNGQFPGPLRNEQIGRGRVITIPVMSVPGFEGPSGQGLRDVTGSENLVLGLLGGLRMENANIVYDPSAVGRGPVRLSTANPRAYSAYLDPPEDVLSWRTNENGLRTGRFRDNLGRARDSLIPEFLDRFPNPLPILYLRSTGPGVEGRIAGMNDPGASFEMLHVLGYTDETESAGLFLGEGRDFQIHGLREVGDPGDTMEAVSPPWEAYPYFRNPNTGRARQEEGFILISPGPDRTYGTDQDITNFGAVRG